MRVDGGRAERGAGRPQPSRGASGAGPLSDDIAAFATAMERERGSAAHTVRAYSADLRDLAAHAARQGVRTSAGLDLEVLRDWLWRGSQARLAPATLAQIGRAHV